MTAQVRAPLTLSTLDGLGLATQAELDAAIAAEAAARTTADNLRALLVDARFTDARTPSGAASGDLSGTFPGPVVAKLNGVAVTGTPSLGQVPTASSGTAATWQTPAGGGAIRVKDEGVSVVAAATGLNFAGAGVTVTDAGVNEALVTIPGGGSSETPWNIVIPSWQRRDSRTGSDWTAVPSSVAVGGSLLVTDDATLPSSATWKVLLGAGTWTFRLTYEHHPNNGIINIKLDGTSIGTVDTYATAQLLNQILTITGVVVATTGVKALMLDVATKNAAGTYYQARVTSMQMQRTA